MRIFRMVVIVALTPLILVIALAAATSAPDNPASLAEALSSWFRPLFHREHSDQAENATE
jgi:hypothetical protein